MTIGQRIRNRRIELGLSVDELAERLGKNRATVYRYESDAIKDMPVPVLGRLAVALDTTPADLMGVGEDQASYPDLSPIAKKAFPLYDGIAAGQPRLIPDGIECYIDATTDIKADFVLKVHGDSMTGARINDGDLVFIRVQPMVENGEIAAVGIDDSATLKRVYYDKTKQVLTLVAENPNYAPMVFTGESLNEVTIFGKAIAFQSDVR